MAVRFLVQLEPHPSHCQGQGVQGMGTEQPKSHLLLHSQQELDGTWP